MNNQENVKKLPDYIKNYVKRVIGANYQIIDSPTPCSIKNKNPEIHLPITEKSLSEFLGAEFVNIAPPQLLFSIVIGLAYHEVAHLESGEKDCKPHMLNNIICDSNDFNYVPDRWKGSIPFTLSLVNTNHRQSMDTTQIPLNTEKDKLQALIHLTITFLRKLRIKYNDQNLRSLPQDHPLFDCFEKIKPIAKKARKVSMEERPKLVKQLHQILKEFWPKENPNNPALPTLSQALEEVKREVTVELTANDVEKLLRALRQTGSITGINDEYYRTIVTVKEEERKEEQKKTEQAVKKIEDHGYGHSDESEEIPGKDMPPVEVDERIVAKLRKAIQPLLFERSIKRRTPSTKGTKFSPGNFYQIKTKPEEPKIRKEIKKISRSLDETEIILCFDRSGSMAGEKEEITKKVAGTLYKAITTIPKTKIQIIGFDDKTTIIKGARPEPIETVLKRINSGLTARGGTNLPKALLHNLKTIKNSTAHKKIIITLTDGDLNGQIPIPELLRYAGHIKADVYCIGVIGSDPEELGERFAKDKTLYVEEIAELPKKISQLAIKRI